MTEEEMKSELINAKAYLVDVSNHISQLQSSIQNAQQIRAQAAANIEYWARRINEAAEAKKKAEEAKKKKEAEVD